jgi:geranylgeranyl reductase family protein
MTARRPDVIVVGGGPGGSVAAWDLARRGVDVMVLERRRFPREKVCGDYVEPRGLRIMESMDCLSQVEQSSPPPLPISRSATWVEGVPRYRGPIPFYGAHPGLPPHGYIVPRDRLDAILLEAAEEAGASIRQGAAVTAVRASPVGVEVEASSKGRERVLRAALVIGSDGANSVVARSAGLLDDDPRHIAVAQRAYAEGLDGEIGEAEFFFDLDLFPGYGWMFPMAEGRVNLGVGILSETRQRRGLHVPELFRQFVAELRRIHPRAAALRLCAPPIGGVVKTYGAAGPNHFDGGLLIGDAGSFVDPMTGEGITPAMESALLATSVVADALAEGRFDRRFLSAYERRFRAYFDPSMVFLDVCAAMLRNRHMGQVWLAALARGCEVAEGNETFARVAGAYFGGMDVNPPGILAQLWVRMARGVGAALPRGVLGLIRGNPAPLVEALADFTAWQAGWWRSLADDPVWHAQWSMDVQRKWLGLMSMIERTGTDPRAAGPAEALSSLSSVSP